MNRRKSNIVVMILLCLGVFGFLYTLVTNPSSLLVQAGMIFLFIGVVLLVYRFFNRRRSGGKEYSAYLRAAKQSKRRFNEQNQRKTQLSGVRGKKSVPTTTKKSTVSSINKKRTNTHLTVIEGKKGKKKNRAFF
ncbi:SA1362 family protein [Fredinandcohnia quinoae]|uniref:YqhP n=1 Tax=Fredinandcohnia quinoae TaxID=2918902 RepID=A0AAW5E4Y9_9BACI|nr:SA1362 family protein [Fredinandcohnia sp. SECRCQ15]MCH1626609.1 hypothetical protein [Fredinandcohnia sp. SECRCQ15]